MASPQDPAKFQFPFDLQDFKPIVKELVSKPGDPAPKEGILAVQEAAVAEKDPKEIQNLAQKEIESVDKKLESIDKKEKDRLKALKNGGIGITGAPTAKALEFVEGIASALSAQSSNVDLSPLKLCYIRDNLRLFTNQSSDWNGGGWDNFICIEDNDVSSFMSKVYGFSPRQKALRQFLDLRSETKAQLFPMVRLYKVQGKTETEIQFPTSARESIQSILRGGNQDDFGLKSVEFDFKNQNAFGAGRIVDVTIQVYLLSGQSLLRDRGGYSVADLVLRRGQLDPEVYDTKSYELRLDVGYMYPGREGKIKKESLEDNKVSMILNLVEYDLNFEQNGVINLTMNYKARIETDLEDKLNYDILNVKNLNIATRIKQVQDRVNEVAKEIVKYNAEGQEAEKELARLNELERYNNTTEGREKLIKQQGTIYVKTLSDVQQAKRRNAKSTIRQTSQKIKRAQERIATLKGEQAGVVGDIKRQNKIAKYGDLLQRLVGDNKIKSTLVPKTSLIIYGEEFRKILQEKIDESVAALKLSDAEDIARASNFIRAEAQQNAIKTGIDSGEIESLDFAAVVNQKIKDAKAQGREMSLKEAIASISIADSITQIGNSSVKQKKQNWFYDNLNAAYGSNFGSVADGKPEYSEFEKIYWFYFGDLINYAMQVDDISDKMTSDKLGFVFGPINIDVGGGNFVDLANMADVPITVEMYQQFFTKTIVDKDLEVVYLRDFVTQAVNQLLLPSLNQKCFGASLENPITVDSGILEIADSLDNVYISSGRLGPLSRRFSMDEDFKKSLAHSRLLANSGTVPTARRWNYMMFYSNDGRVSSDWEGKEKNDLLKGIFHFRPGIDRGLVKQVNFRKNKKPGFTTMMVERAFAENKESLQLWAIFDIELTMIGNTLLRPGMHIYLDPSTVAMGSPQSKASFSRSIGLGGYYLVTSVSNSISDGEWETQVIAKWVTSGSSAGSTRTAPKKATQPQAKEAIGKDKKPANKKKKRKKNLSGFGLPITTDDFQRSVIDNVLASQGKTSQEGNE